MTAWDGSVRGNGRDIKSMASEIKKLRRAVLNERTRNNKLQRQIRQITAHNAGRVDNNDSHGVPRKIRIQIVEDESLVALDLKALIESYGYTVSGIASTAAEAFRLAERDNPSVILMDIVLKDGSDGIEAAQRINAVWNIPVIYLSAYDDADTLARANLTGPYGYIVKPAADTELRRELAFALERSRLDQALRVSRDSFVNLVDKSPDGIMVTDTLGSVLYCNRTLSAMLGAKISKIMGEVFGELSGSDEMNEVDIVRADGTAGVAELRSVDSHWLGKSAHLLSFRDVTARVRSTEEIRRLSAFPSNNPNPVVEYDAVATSVIYANDAARKIADELGSQSVEGIMPGDYRGIIKGCVANGEPALWMELSVKDRILTWSFYPIADTKTVHCYGFDITDVKSLEGQLFQAQKMEAVGQLAAGIAHEVNNALAGVIGMAELIKRGIGEGDEIDIVLQEGHRAGQIVQSLLAYSRSDAGQPTSVNFPEIVKQILKIGRNDMSIRNVEVKVSIPDNLPGVLVDPKLLQQVLINLLINARDAMPSGGTVEIHACESEGKVRISVLDNGTGIAESSVHRIFDPFFTTKGTGKGSGMGLSVVAGIIKSSGGSIEARNREQGGAEFIVTLPAVSDGSVSELDDSEDITNLPRGLKILIVDDEKNVRDFCVRFLRASGNRPVSARTVDEAVINLQNDTFDVVLSDQSMPGKNGLELLDYLKKLNRPESSRFILMSGRPPARIPKGVKMLLKPVSAHSLAASVKAILGNSGI